MLGLINARKSGLILILIALIGVLLVSVRPGLAQQNGAAATVAFNANLRTGPDASSSIVGSVSAGTIVTISARSGDSTWLLVTVPGGKRGWLMARQVDLASGVNLAALPVSAEIVSNSNTPSQNTLQPTPPPQLPAALPATEGAIAPFAPISGDLTAYAAQVTPAIRGAMRNVFALGQSLGNNPRVFAKVGDCLEGHVWFLYQYGDGKPYDLGPYTQLQATINYFMTAPRQGVPNPFIAESQAAHSAFTSASVQDAEWADPKLCHAGETPLQCEYRLDKPSVAIIMFGVVDVESLTASQFDSSLRSVIQQTLALGIIPIMSTAPENQAYGDKAAQFNRIVTEIAVENNVPLIHLRDALAPLPAHGLDRDGLHLTPGAGWVRVAFTPQQLQLGLSVWNLLALQSLENVWQGILS